MEKTDWVDDRLDEWAPYVRGGVYSSEGSSAGVLREPLDHEHESAYMPPRVELTEMAVAKVRSLKRLTEAEQRRDTKSDLFKVLMSYYVARHSDVEIASKWGRTVGFVRSLRHQAKSMVGIFILVSEDRLKYQVRPIH